jgi:hypothetical protein
MSDPSIDMFGNAEVMIRHGCHQGLMGDASKKTKE